MRGEVTAPGRPPASRPARTPAGSGPCCAARCTGSLLPAPQRHLWQVVAVMHAWRQRGRHQKMIQPPPLVVGARVEAAAVRGREGQGGQGGSEGGWGGAQALAGRCRVLTPGAVPPCTTTFSSGLEALVAAAAGGNGQLPRTSRSTSSPVSPVRVGHVPRVLRPEGVHQPRAAEQLLLEGLPLLGGEACVGGGVANRRGELNRRGWSNPNKHRQTVARVEAGGAKPRAALPPGEVVNAAYKAQEQRGASATIPTRRLEVPWPTQQGRGGPTPPPHHHDHTHTHTHTHTPPPHPPHPHPHPHPLHPPTHPPT